MASMETILPILDEAMEIEDQLLLKNKFVDIHQIISLDSRRSVPKVFGFAENIVQSYSDIQFRADFRISKVTFERLVLELSPLIEYDDRPDGKEALDVRKQILVFMWYISNQDSMREIASRFGISKSTVFRCIRRVSCALCDIRSKLIKWPDIETQQEISEAVERRCKVPNVIGFIDGTHIRLSCCPGDDNSYINWKGYPSIVLQLIVDDRLVIRDCYVGWPGSTHDARVFRNSPIFTSLQTGQAVLGRDNFLIGDGAYPVSSFMITPIKNTGRLTNAEKHFNTKVSSARQTVERAIGHLKGRFRRLRDVHCCKIEDACKLVTAACVLHNLCLFCHDDVIYLLEDALDVNNYPPVYPNNLNGLEKRNNLVQYLAQFM